jgi:serine/threonine protein kinase
MTPDEGASCEPGASVLPEPWTAANTPAAEAGRRSAVVELAYQRFHELEAAGDKPDLRAFCDGYPECRSALLRLLLFDTYAEKHPEILSEEEAEAAVGWPQVGEQRGDLTILRLLGRGQFARVYLAAEGSTGGRHVVVKFSLLGGAEARMLGRLPHPNIVPILWARLEETTGLTLVCMPFLGSATLENTRDDGGGSAGPRPKHTSAILEILKARALPEDPPAAPADARLRQGSYADGIIHLAIQLADALAFVHAHGVCHRDLKPSNVLLDPSGKPLLLDFNLSTSSTEPNVPPGGTLHYMAPEQLRAFRNKRRETLDERADLFALGVMIYELLTGEHPSGPIPSELCEQALAQFLLERWKGGVRPLHDGCPSLEWPVAAVLDRCLAFDPADRPSGAAELGVLLRRQFSPARRLRRWVMARRRSIACSLLLLLLSLVAAGFAWSRVPPYAERCYLAGERAYKQGNYDDAEKRFTQALETDPHNVRYRLARGCTRLKQSKRLPGNSEKLDGACTDLFPDSGSMDPPALAAAAYIASRRQKPREAILMYNQLEKSGYRPLMVRNNRAYNLILAKRFTEAAADLQAAQEIESDCQAVYYNRALLELFRRIADPRSTISPQALNDIVRAINLGPSTSTLYRDAARLHAAAAQDAARGVPVWLDVPLVTALQLRSRQQLIDQGRFYVEAAVAQGGTIASIQSDAYLHFLLTSAPAIDRLLSLQPGQAPSFVELRLIDPIDLP